VRRSGGYELVALGASWGGFDALRLILGSLPAKLAAAVVVAQHRAPASHPSAFSDLLGAATPLSVREAEDKDALHTGTVFVAPPDYHLLVDPGTLSLSTDAPLAYARPSIDVLLETAAESYRERCVGVVLTGASADGAQGLARVVELGGAAIVQDPADARRYEMPRAALSRAPSARVATAAEIGPLLVDLCGLTGVPV
jgi:two-component system chemotaxis response regulator CheB